jgi:metallopeptidase family M12-like protein/uncharacterized protein DUF11
MANRCSTALCALALLVGAAGASAADFRIRHAESIDLPAAKLATADSAKPATELSFEAYGRRFDLELEPNERLLSKLSAAEKSALARYPVYRGRLQGAPESWVRLTRIGRDVHGMIWDGAQLYLLEPARNAERFMIAQGQLAPSTTAIYRLADTESDLGAEFCKVVTPAEKSPAAAAAYQSLVGELKEAALAAAPTGQMEVALLGDFEFTTDHPGDAEATALARLNAVDGIFSDQVGVHLQVTTVRMFATATDPFSATAVADALLDEVGLYKSNAANGIRATGVAHLMTGRNLDGQTVGIAFTSSICSARFGASLSMGGTEISNANAVLVAAHEIGHNFGAPHDTEAGSACESTVAGFLMEPRVNGSSTFSSCSLMQIRPEVEAAACITPFAFADGALSATPGTVSTPVDQATAWAVNVSSVGGLALDGTTVTIAIPASITVDSAVPTAGTCSAGGGAVTCDLGSIPGGSSRRIDMSVRGSQNGSFTAAVTLAASNDSNVQNNTLNVSLNVGQVPTPAPGNGGGGGGGGALGGFVLLGLLAAALRRLGVRASANHRQQVLGVDL